MNGLDLLDLFVWGLGATCIVLLTLGHFAKNSRLEFWGDIFLALSFGFDASIFLYFHHFLMGVAFSLPAITQAHALLAAHLRRNRKRATQ